MHKLSFCPKVAESTSSLNTQIWCVCVCVCVCTAIYSKRAGKFSLKMSYREFPDSSVVKNPPCNAGDTGLMPSQGTKIPHTAGQLSP